MKSDMPYRTILVHVDRSSHAASRIRIAAELAVRESAHLIGAAMTGIPRYVFEQSEVDLTRTVMANHVDTLYQRADEVLRGPRARLGPPWSKDHRTALAATIVIA